MLIGGLSRAVEYDVSQGSRAAILRAADMCPRRQALGQSLNMDSLEVALKDPHAGLGQGPRWNIHGRPAQHIRGDARQTVPGRHVIRNPRKPTALGRSSEMKW